MTLIAKLCHVSIHTVIRELHKFRKHLPSKYNLVLPKVLMVDEFRSHAKKEAAMSFICANGESGKLVDVLPDRKFEHLIPHFKESPYTQKVEFLVTDMNAAYYELMPKVFHNVKLVIDRFHIIKHINQAFNHCRIREVKRLISLGGESAAKGRKIKSN